VDMDDLRPKPRRRVDPREVDWRLVGIVTLVTLLLVGWYAFATSSGGDDEVSTGTTLPDVTTTAAGPQQGPNQVSGPNPAAGPTTTAGPGQGTPTTNPASVPPSTVPTTTTAPPTTQPPIQNVPENAPQPGVTHTVQGTLLIDSPHTIAPGTPCGGQGPRYQDFQVGQTVVLTDANGSTVGQGTLDSCTWDGTTACPSCGPGYETGRPQFTYSVSSVPEVASYVTHIAWAVWQPVPLEEMRARDWVLGLTMA
jgi:hypothetical protein